MAKTIHRAEYRELLDVLRARRVARGLSQSSVARALGWSQQKFSAVESGARRLDVIEFVEFARALGLTPVRALGLAARQLTRAPRSRRR